MLWIFRRKREILSIYLFQNDDNVQYAIRTTATIHTELPFNSSRFRFARPSVLNCLVVMRRLTATQHTLLHGCHTAVPSRYYRRTEQDIFGHMVNVDGAHLR